jgi:GAF domain-containing protein
MTSEKTPFLRQMVEVLTSTVSFGERLNNMVHLLARNLKVDMALYFGMDKARETLILNVISQGPVQPHLRLEFPLGQGLVGETAKTRKVTIVHRQQPGVSAANVSLEKLHPAYQTLAAFPVADENFLYGVLILVDRAERSLTLAERQSVQLTCLMLGSALRQAIVQEEAKKRIAELSVLFEVGKTLTSTVELDELLERIVSTTAKVITARGASLRIINGASGEPRVSSHYGQIPPECPPLPQIIPSEAATEPRYYEGESTDAAGHTHYCLAVPLSFKGQLTGTLGVYDKFNPNGEYLPFDLENRQLLFTMAGVIVNGIENALTYQQLEDIAEYNERKVKHLQTLVDTASIEPYILRSIEFSPEHHETGMTILNYFGTVLRQKYPGMKVKVIIEQDNLMVRMIIQTDEGNIEKIERTLGEYGLVIKGELPLEDFFSNPFEILQLKNQIKIANLQLENQKELLGLQKSLQGDKISELEEEVKWLRSHVANILIYSQNNIAAIKEVIRESRELLDSRDGILESAISLIGKKLQDGITQNDLPEVKQTLDLIHERNPNFFEKFVDKLNILIIQGSISGVAGNLLYDLIKSFSKTF